MLNSEEVREAVTPAGTLRGVAPRVEAHDGQPCNTPWSGAHDEGTRHAVARERFAEAALVAVTD